MRRTILSLFLVFAFCVGVSAQQSIRRSELMVTLEGSVYHLHTVARGETLRSIAAAYDVSEAAILTRNPFVERGLRVGQTLLVASSAKRAETKTDASRSIAPPTVVPDLHKQRPARPVEHQYTAPPVNPSVNMSADASANQLGLTRRVDPREPLNVAMLLPFGLGRTDATFVDFYRGSLLALSALKQSGVRVEMDVLSTAGSAQSVENLVRDGSLDRANLIIGPVYDAPFEVVARYAAMHAVPIVSPLGGTGAANSPYVVAVAPDETSKWDKLRTMLADPTANVILIEHQQFADTAVLEELASILPYGTKRLPYNGKETPVNELSVLLDQDRQNIVVVAISNENAAEQVLARLSSINSARRYKLSVVGTSRWARFSTMDMELLFKLSATYPSSYFMDRSDPRVAQFYRDYINAFGSMPTLFSFRGYDVVKTFVSLIVDHGDRALLELEGYQVELLQTPYQYSQQSPYEKFANTDWAIVTYHPNYTVSVQ